MEAQATKMPIPSSRPQMVDTLWQDIPLLSGQGCDIWVLKLNTDGSVAWQKTYGGSGDDEAYSIQQTSDGGYIVAGDTDSFGAGTADVWVLKLDSDGTVAWQKTYGGTGVIMPLPSSRPQMVDILWQDIPLLSGQGA